MSLNCLTALKPFGSDSYYKNLHGDAEKNVANIFIEQIKHLRSSSIDSNSISLSQKMIDHAGLFLTKYKEAKSVPSYVKDLERVVLSFCYRFPWASETNRENKESLKLALAKHDSLNFQKWTKNLAQPDDFFFKTQNFLISFSQVFCIRQSSILITL